ncbi:FAD monooxygenase [Balamuthia mandrillaris]
MEETDLVIVGAGPVGLLCAYLGHLCDLRVVIVDKSSQPLQVGRADALNARTLQLLEVVKLFQDLFPLGKPCNTSSVFCDGKFLSRQSTWWEALEGCFHKHFLMLGQAFVEQLLDRKLSEVKKPVRRNTTITNIEVKEDGCMTTLMTGEVIHSRFVIGADGSRSFVRSHFNIPFEITRPEIVWAVVDGVLDTDFEKVPEIIVFQSDTSDVAWIPREQNIDRFYIRMDRKEFTFEEVLEKINRALHPYRLSFKEVAWFSQFSVKESLAENFIFKDKIILAGDASHIHSVNGGQGLNTGLADAFNLMWKLHFVLHHSAPLWLLKSYEEERKPVAKSVIETSGALVRTTKYAQTGERSHAENYVRLIEKKAGNITGMGIGYGSPDEPMNGKRLHDFLVIEGEKESRVYSHLDYRFFTLFIFGEFEMNFSIPPYVQIMRVQDHQTSNGYWTPLDSIYSQQLVLVRPDSYIAVASPISDPSPIYSYLQSMTTN